MRGRGIYYYRSQHELIGVFGVGDAPHQNNVALRRHGRNRSNVWTYPGVNGFCAGRGGPRWRCIRPSNR